MSLWNAEEKEVCGQSHTLYVRVGGVAATVQKIRKLIISVTNI